MNILLFGASGTAGGAVLQACLDASVVKDVRVIVRRPLGWTDAKLWELQHTNYLDYAAVTEAFRKVDACLFCLGTSVTQVSEEEFVKISHDYAIAAARMLKAESPAAVFHYISGKGTRAESRTFWSKVKGQTENELMELVGADSVGKVSLTFRIWRLGWLTMIAGTPASEVNVTCHGPRCVRRCSIHV